MVDFVGEIPPYSAGGHFWLHKWSVLEQGRFICSMSCIIFVVYVVVVVTCFHMHLLPAGLLHLRSLVQSF